MSEKKTKSLQTAVAEEVAKLVKNGEIKVPEIPQDPDPCGNGKKPVLPKPPKTEPLDPRLGRD